MRQDAKSHFKRRVEALEAFGHRGSATTNEDRAADYLVHELTGIGLAAVKEPFTGSSSQGASVFVHVAGALLGAALLLVMPLASAVIGFLVLASFAFQSSTRFVLLGRLVARAPSRNVVARIAAAGSAPASRRLVVCAHMDTQRSGWIWSEALAKRFAGAAQTASGPAKSPLFLVVVAFVVEPLAGVAAALHPGLAAIPWIAVALLAVLAIAAVLLGQWARGAFVPGACDNATGVAAALALAEAFREQPSAGTELVVLLTGCEESGALGAAAWLDLHRAELEQVPTRFLVLDTLGYGRPRFLSCEYSLAGWPARYPEDMQRLCSDAARRLGIEGAGPHELPTFTDGLAFLARGIPGAAILTFEDGGYLPNYHQMTDTAGRMSFEIGWAAVELAEAVLRSMAQPAEDAGHLIGARHSA